MIHFQSAQGNMLALRASTPWYEVEAVHDGETDSEDEAARLSHALRAHDCRTQEQAIRQLVKIGVDAEEFQQ